MFVRKTKSRSSTCFQVGHKRNGKFVLVKHVGCASTPAEIEALRLKAKQELVRIVYENQLSMFPDKRQTSKAKLLGWHITGYHLVFGSVYDSIGFPNNLLRDLVVARIVYPKSKLSTIRYLGRHMGINLPKDRVYRFLDRLDKNELSQIAFRFVSQRNNGISLIFYDVTTLYFEVDNEDTLRKKGYSKDHRSDIPQILIGLFVDHDGYPFDFDFFDGKTFEGNTFQVAIGNLMAKYSFDKLTVVADAGMLSEANLSYLESVDIGYIVGARLRSLGDKLTQELGMHDFTKASVVEIPLQGRRLIIEFSQTRAKKDRSNREKQVEKLKLDIASKRQLIRKSKYLAVARRGKIIGLDQNKIDKDKQYDGLKGYIANRSNGMVHQEIIAQYHNLWKVEKAFRMSKGDLKERPIYHFVLQRIRSHLLICFVSLLVMKETERILKQEQCSLEKAIEALGRIGQGEVRIGNVQLEIDSELDQEAQSILKLFEGH